MIEFFFQAFITLFVVIDPIGITTVFIGLTPGAKRHHQKKMAIRGIMISAVVLYLFAFAGSYLLKALGIGFPAFRMAGGVLLFLLAVEMLFARESGLRSTTGPEMEEADHRNDISVFPLAIPMIAGPGAMTSLLLLLGKSSGLPMQMAGVLIVLAVVLLLTLFTLLFAMRLNALLGVTGANVISRVLGIILSALAVQFILDGLMEALPGLAR